MFGMDFRFSHKETIYQVRTELRQDSLLLIKIVYWWKAETTITHQDRV